MSAVSTVCPTSSVHPGRSIKRGTLVIGFLYSRLTSHIGMNKLLLDELLRVKQEVIPERFQILGICKHISCYFQLCQLLLQGIKDLIHFHETGTSIGVNPTNSLRALNMLGLISSNPQSSRNCSNVPIFFVSSILIRVRLFCDDLKRL